jgi:hypothetical protein
MLWRQLIASRRDWFGVGPGASLPLWGRADRRQFIDTADVGSTPAACNQDVKWRSLRRCDGAMTLAVWVLGRIVASSRSAGSRELLAGNDLPGGCGGEASV